MPLGRITRNLLCLDKVSTKNFKCASSKTCSRSPHMSKMGQVIDRSSSAKQGKRGEEKREEKREEVKRRGKPNQSHS